MNEIDELLMIKKKIFKMMHLKQEKDKRYEELSKNKYVKEYLSLVKDREYLRESIESETKSYLERVKNSCPHDTYVFKKPNILNSNGVFVIFNFVCADCQNVVKFTFFTGLGKIDQYKTNISDKLFEFLNSVNVVTSFTTSQEEVIEFFKEYLCYAEWESIEKAENYCRSRMKIKD